MSEYSEDRSLFDEAVIDHVKSKVVQSFLYYNKEVTKLNGSDESNNELTQLFKFK